MIVRHRASVPAFAPSIGAMLDRSFDRTFDQLTSSLFDTRHRVPDVQASWDDDTLVLVVDLPGVPADAVAIEVSGRNLTLAAHTESLQWSRSLQLGSGLDPEKVTARHRDGRLTVRIGSIDEPETRSVAIDTSAEEPAPSVDQSIEASSTDVDSTDAGSTDTTSSDDQPAS